MAGASGHRRGWMGDGLTAIDGWNLMPVVWLESLNMIVMRSAFGPDGRPTKWQAKRSLRGG